MSDTATPTRPTQEIGTPYTQGGIKMPPALAVANPYWELLDTTEYVRDLKWPRSREIYDRMRRDGQVNGLWMGMTLPLRRYQWSIDPNGAREEVVTKIAEDMNLSIKGADTTIRRRQKGRFNHDEHLSHALLSLAYGFMFFEQVGEIQPTGRRGKDEWRLKRLSPRMPHSIYAILTDRQDGGLVGIRQKGIREVIPVSQLVAYPWQKEGANWYGVSWLRPIYKHWFIKDKLMRIDVVKHERNGMGVPTARATIPDVQPHQLTEAHRVAEQWRAGELSSAALPYGTDIELKGVTGTLPDTIASAKYHDECMARSMLMMFLQLGHTRTGSRALGDSFIDYFNLAQETIALWYSELTSQYVIEDWVDWNFGPDEPAPLLTYERTFDREYSVADLILLIQEGAIQVDEALENWLRDEGGLPERDTPRAAVELPPPGGVTPSTPEPKATPDGGPGQTSRGRAMRQARRRTRSNGRKIRTAQGEVTLPDRPLSRDPNAAEMTAGVNFKQMDDAWQTSLEDLLSSWPDVKAAQIADLKSKISSTSDLVELASVQADPLGDDIILEQLKKLVQSGADSALAEAKFQGKALDMPDMTKANALEQVRAQATAAMLARSLSEAAGRRAISVSGGSLSKSEVADDVESYLTDLSGAYLRDQFSGVLSQAQSAGRRMVFEEGRPERLYSSEILDANTCQACASEDGTEFTSMDDAEKEYPGGGFVDCAGGPRCRGMLIAVYGEGKVEDVAG